VRTARIHRTRLRLVKIGN